MLVLLAAVVVVAVLVMWGFGAGPFSTTETTTTTGTGSAVATGGLNCPDTLATTLTLTVTNHLNTSGYETYDQTARLYKVQSDGTESLFATMTDTTAGTTTLNCGETYRVRLQSGDAVLARIDGVRSGNGAVLGGQGRYVEFVANSAVYNLEIESAQRGVLKFKAFDLDKNGWVFAADELAASAYRTAPVTFKSVTDNATATALGSGEMLDWRFDIEADGEDVDANDFGLYVLIDASTAQYEEPVITFAGRVLSEVSGTLDTFEGRAFSSYEYVYRIDSSIENRKATMTFSISPVSGVNPTEDVKIVFAGIGAVKETSSNAMRYSATTDASSPATVFTLQEVTLDIS
jgi:hypothetical protein